MKLLMAQADGSLTQTDDICSVKLPGTSLLVHVAYSANELAALHLNGWLAFTRAVHSRGLHWVWAPAGPNANLVGAGGFTFAAGGSGRSENFAGDPFSTHEVEKEIKAAVYLTKAKQGKSDIWKQFSIVTEKKGRVKLISKLR